MKGLFQNIIPGFRDATNYNFLSSHLKYVSRSFKDLILPFLRRISCPVWKCQSVTEFGKLCP